MNTSTPNPRIGKQPMMVESTKFESLDIDTPADWDFGVVGARYLMGHAQ